MKTIFKTPAPMKKKWSLLQQEMFGQYAQWMYDMRSHILPENKLTDKERQCICHNFSFEMNCYIKDLMDKLIKF